MNSDLSKVKPGAWICTIQHGWVKVTEVLTAYGVTYPIITDQFSYTTDGKNYDSHLAPSAFVDPPDWLLKLAGPTPCEFKKGQKVLVRDRVNTPFVRRYFSHKGERGIYYCFDGGKDEWTSEGRTTHWLECRAWEDDA